MIIVRDVYQAKLGKGDELVKLLKEGEKIFPKVRQRLLTDASGPFFTIVQELELANLAEWEKVSQTMWASKEFGSWFERWLKLVESGRREFWNVEG
jgi:hypothetical protein